MAAIYAVYTSPTHPPIPNHLPTLIVTPHGQPSNILYSYLHTNFNTENYLLTPSPQGDLCVAKLFPPQQRNGGKASASDPGHSSASASRVVRCEASRNLKWSITNTGVISPIYKLSLPSPDSPDLPLFQVSKPNPNANFWSMFYFAYAGHNIPPKRIEFGKIQKNPPGTSGGGTRISITGKTPEEKAVWQTLGEGNEDCVEWVVLCAALNLLDDEIMKAAEKNPPPPMAPMPAQNGGRSAPVALQDPGQSGSPLPGQRPPPGPGAIGPQRPPQGPGSSGPQWQPQGPGSVGPQRPPQGPVPGLGPQRPQPQHANSLPPGGRPPVGYQGQQPPRGPMQPMPYNTAPPQGMPPQGYMGQGRMPPQQMRNGTTGPIPPNSAFGGRPPQQMQQPPPGQMQRF